MSASGRDSRSGSPVTPADGDDPWAKWRQPEAAPAAEAEKPARPAKQEPAATSSESTASAKDTEASGEASAKAAGTLGVRRTRSDDKASHKPLRGGSPLRKAVAKATAPVERAATPRPQGKASSVKPTTGRPAAASKPASGKRETAWAVSAKATVTKPVVSAASAETATPEGVRLSKVMSGRGLCSRREADLWIERGWVYVDGRQVSELGTRIDPQADISISKEAEKDQAKQVTILLHKPVGYVSGQPEPGCTPAVTLITPEAQVPQSGDPEFKPWMLRGLAPAGRLDVDSTGLLVLTSDGRVAKKLIGEDSDAEKEYLVRVSGQMIKGGLDLLRHGLELDGKPLRQAWVKQLNEDQLHFILKEGKKRQIRRMCELVGLKVIGLKRVRIGRIRLGDLPMGQWRFLRADEAF
jgi:23S rRNA pseudouridine2604 synthase